MNHIYQLIQRGSTKPTAIDSVETPKFIQNSLCQIASPALLDISKPNIEPAVQHHQKIQTLSLKFSALNISSPTSVSVRNNNNTDANKTTDDSIETESGDLKKVTCISATASNASSRTVESDNATASTNESSTATVGTNDRSSAFGSVSLRFYEILK